MTVVDNTSTSWDGIIEETVNDFNAVMPKHGPRLLYVRGKVMACGEDFDICSGELVNGYLGLALLSDLGKGHIQVSDTASLNSDGMEVVACHEFMHVLTLIRDNYGANPESCVWGYRKDPGPFDIAKLKSVYDREHEKKAHPNHKDRHKPW